MNAPSSSMQEQVQRMPNQLPGTCPTGVWSIRRLGGVGCRASMWQEGKNMCDHHITPRQIWTTHQCITDRHFRYRPVSLRHRERPPPPASRVALPRPSTFTPRHLLHPPRALPGHSCGLQEVNSKSLLQLSSVHKYRALLQSSIPTPEDHGICDASASACSHSDAFFPSVLCLCSVVSCSVLSA